MIGKIQRIRLREVWRHEAADFTTWLEENIDVLNQQLGLALTGAEREQSAGAFSVDLVAEDENGDTVIIENQLEKSDHDHLGKLITYLTFIGAKAAVWIVETPRPEHIQAISWLNESSPAAFYLVKLEAIKIGDSPPAPLLTLIAGPSAEAREAGQKKKELSQRSILRKQFWTDLLDHSNKYTKLHSNISPQPYNWIGTSAGLPKGVGLNYSVRSHDSQIEIYIDAGQGSEEYNLWIFEQLISHRAEIEESFGGELKWDGLESKRACRISKRIQLGGWKDESTWPEVHAAMVRDMIRFDAALRPYLKRLKRSRP